MLRRGASCAVLQMQLAARVRAMQADARIPPDQLAASLQKLATLQHQVGTQLALVRP